MKYKFLDFIADTQNCVLTQNGLDIPIKTQAFEILALLLEHSNRIVYKEEILQKVWAGRTVSSGSVDTRMKMLRKRLGDNGVDQKIIKTFRHRGYKFIPDVIKIKPEKQPEDPVLIDDANLSPHIKPLSKLVITITLVIISVFALIVFKFAPSLNSAIKTDGTSVAVIISEDDCLGHKAQTISNRIISRLTSFKDGRVISSNSANIEGLKKLSIGEIGSVLNVSYVISLDCTPHNEQLEEVHVNIFNNSEGTVLWGESFFSNKSDSTLSGVDSRIVSKSIQKISDLTGLSNEIPVLSPAQYEAKIHWEKALAWIERNDKESLDNAIEALEKLISLEPNFGPAYAKLVSTYNRASHYAGMPNAHSKERADHYLSLGLAKAPKNVDLNLEKAAHHKHHGEYDKALVKLDFVLDTNPNSGEALLLKAHLFHLLRRSSVAEEIYERAMLFDPLSSELLANYTHLQIDLGNYEAAYEMAHKNAKWNSGSAAAYQMLGRLYYEQGDYLNAFNYLETSLMLNPDHYRAQDMIVLMFASLGHVEKSYDYLTDDDALAIALAFAGNREELKSRYENPAISSDVAYAYYIIGEPTAFTNIMKPYFHEMGFNSEDKDVSRIDAHFMAGLTLLLKEEDPTIDVSLIKAKLARLYQKKPLNAESRQEDYLGMFMAEVLNEDYENALSILEAALDAGIVLRFIEKLPGFENLTETERFQELKKRMIVLSNMEIAKIEAIQNNK